MCGLLIHCTHPLCYVCRGKEREVEDCAKKVERDKLAAKRAKSKHKKLKMASDMMVWIGELRA